MKRRRTWDEIAPFAIFSNRCIENGVERRARGDELRLAWRLYERHEDLRRGPLPMDEKVVP